MPIRAIARACLPAVLAGCLSASFFGQQNNDACSPPIFKIYKEKNMFSEQQEDWLGGILDAQAVKGFSTIQDPEGDYLQNLGERLLAQLPSTGRQYRFYIIDAPVNNAFSLGGSRVYVTRQLIAFLKNEDELAGLLGHELGHIVTHQVAIDVTKMFRKVLGVDQVTDQADIFAKWNELEDVWRKKNVPLHDEERGEDEQQIADRIGIYVMTRAGYQPARLPEFFDRLTENKGKTGNFLTDLFGTTSPNAKRVRLLINSTTPLPQQCLATAPAGAPAHFLDWQRAVIGARRLETKESVGGIISKATLKPPLRGSLEYLQFSPDGRYLLAQDESSVFVLSREPLAPLFRIDALAAQWAQFTADSRSVVFHDDELRVEKWDIEKRERVSAYAVSTPGRCFGTSLDPSGRVLACVRQHKDDYQVELIDVASNAVLFTGPVWAKGELEIGFTALMSLRGREARFAMGFSPDSRYFLLGANQASKIDLQKNRVTDVPGQVVAYDLEAKREIHVPNSIKQIACTRFVFTGPDRIAGFNPDHPERSALVRFPSGELVSEFPLEVNGFPLRGRLIAPAQGAYVLVTPAAMHPIAAIDLELKRFALGYKTPALAIYGKTIAAEELGGRITLFNLADKQRVGTTQLPSSPLPNLGAAAFSLDGKWLAASGRTSGGIWNAETGERALDSGSFGAGFFEQDSLFAMFSKLESKPKIMRLDPAAKTTTDVFTIDLGEPEKKDENKHALVWQAGSLLLTEPPGKNHSVEARDIRTNQLLWTRKFVEFTPTFFYSEAGQTLTLIFEAHDSVKAEAKSDPGLAERLAALPGKNFANLVEVLDPATGKKLGDVLVETGDVSFVLRDAITAGETVLLYDSANRTQVYSLRTGLQRGRVLGKFLAISPGGDRMLVENGKGDCNVYDTSTLQPLSQYSFPHRIIRADFSSGGALLVLTADQTLYRLQALGEQSAGGVKR